MIALASVSGPLPKLGVVVVSLLAAGAILLASRRSRALAMLGALVLAPVLLLGDIWHSPQLNIIHRHPLVAAVGAAVAVAVICGAAILLARRPNLLAPLVLIALPFRIPIKAGGITSNLLVPLYAVVAAGVLAWAVPALLAARRPGGRGGLHGSGGGGHGGGNDGGDGSGDADAGAELPTRGGALWVQRLLALAVVLYAVQSLYSLDFQKALQQIVFFYVPFALLFSLLRSLEWSAQLIRTCLLVVIVLALVFAGIGFAEYATKTLFLNPKLIAANDVHTYFTVNSVFFDPDIFGRFLALVMILVATLLLTPRDPREQVGAVGVLAILWCALVLTLSRSSLAALLVGLATLAATLRWRASRVLMLGAAVVAIGAAAIAISPKTFGLNQGLNNASSGRADLVTGGIHMFASRPVWGYGSAAFVKEYHHRHPTTPTPQGASHTIAVTIAAEQGVIGLAVYIALVLAAVAMLIRGARGDPIRAAIAAAFLALVFHTLLYADFLEDPVLWTLLGVGTALAAARSAVPAPSRRVRTEPAIIPV